MITKTLFSLTIKSVVAAAVGLTAAVGSAMAAYPDKPIRLVVPYTPGGAADQLARRLGDQLGQKLGQPIIVENKPGASTRVAASYVARSVPDGYTIFMGSNASMVLNPMLYSTIDYSYDDYRVVSLITEMPLVVVANPQVPATNLAEFVDHANKNKGKLNYASVGMGNPLHLATEMLNENLGIEVLHVPFNGSAPALASLIANDTQMMVDGVITSLPLIREGRLNALAVMSSERLAVLPEVATVAEQASRDFHVATWFGISTPRATPEEAVKTLHQALGEILQNQEFIDHFSALGMVVQAPRSLEETEAYVARDQALWSKVISAHDIKLD